MADTVSIPSWPSAARTSEDRFSRLRLNGARVLLVLVLGVLWEITARISGNGEFIGQPSVFLKTFGKGIADGTLPTAALTTTEEMLIGLLSGVVGGVLLAFVVNLVPRLGAALQPYLVAVYSLPKLAVAPLMILWIGIGFESVVVFVFLVSFFFIYFSVNEGLRHPPVAVVDQLRLMGAGPVTILRKVLLPSTTDWIFTGLKIAVPYSLIATVGAELISSSGSGVGYIILQALQFNEMNDVFASLVLIVILGLVLNLLTEALRRRAMRWK
jgi:NitT/TauT family transport system permease protein